MSSHPGDRVRLCFEERVAALRVVAGRWRDTQLGAQRVVRLLRRGAGVRTQFLLGVSQLPVIVSQTPERGSAGGGVEGSRRGSVRG